MGKWAEAFVAVFLIGLVIGIGVGLSMRSVWSALRPLFHWVGV